MSKHYMFDSMHPYCKVRIGTYKLDKEMTLTQHYECALWHKDVLVQPGTYDLYVYISPGDLRENTLGHTAYAHAPGIVTDACFAPRFGAHIGEDREGKAMIGREDVGSIQLATYSIDEAVKAGLIELDPEVITYEDREYEGRKYRRYFLLK